MSFGGASQGTIRYALIVDDAQATTKLNTFKTSLTSVGTTSLTAGKNIATMGNNIKTTGTSITQQTAQLNQQASAQQKLSTITATTGKNVAMMGNQFKATTNSIKSAGPPLANLEKTSVSLGTRVKDAGTKFGGLAVGLSATATSALQLGAGFRDFSDAQIAVERVTRKNSLAQEALGKAQDKLNALQKKGVTSGKEYEQAQLDVTQAQKMVEIQSQLLGEAQERLFDSQSQFVVSIVPTVLGAFGTLSMAVKDFGLNMGSLQGVMGKASRGFSGLGGSMLGILGPAGLAAAAALLIIDRLEGMKESLKKAGVQVTQTSKSFIQAIIDMDLAKFNSEMKASMLEFDNLNKVMRTTPLHLATTDWQTLKKEIEAAGGVFDSTGKLMTVAKERVIDLGAGFTATSVQYIKWSQNMIENGADQAKVMKFLTDSGIKAADAQKIYNFALADSKKPLGDVTKGTQDLKKALDDSQTSLEDLRNSYILGSDALEDYSTGVFDNSEELENLRNSFILGSDALEDYTTRTDAVTTSVVDLADKFVLGSDALEDYSTGVYDNTQNLENLRNSFVLGSDALEDYTENTTDLTAALDHATPTIDTMREASVKMANETKKAWQDFATEFNKADLSLASALGLDKKGKAEDVFKNMVKDLPKKLEKELKGNLKAEFKIEESKKGVKMFIESIMDAVPNVKGQFIFDPDLHVDKKKAQKYGKEILNEIKNIDDADTKAAGTKLAEAISKGDMGEIRQAIVDVLDTLDPKPIPVYLVADPNVDTSKVKDPVKVPAKPDFSGWSPTDPAGFEFVDLSGGKGKLEVPANAKIDDVVLSNGVDPGQAAFDANPYSATIDKIQFNPAAAAEGAALATYFKGLVEIAAKDPTLQAALNKAAALMRKNLFNLDPTTTKPTTTKPGDKRIPLVPKETGATLFSQQIQLIQKALDSLTKYGTKNLQALGKAAKTNFNSIANYAAGATTFVQTHQKAIDSLTKFGTKNMQGLGKAAKTNFNSVANYAGGATTAVQTLQKAIDSLAKYGIKNMDALAKASSKDMNGVVKNVQHAQTAVISLIKSIGNLKSKEITITTHYATTGVKPTQHGYHGMVTKPTLFLAGEAGPEYVNVTPRVNAAVRHSGEGSGGGNGTLIVELTNVLADREIVRTYKRKLGENQYRFGPR